MNLGTELSTFLAKAQIFGINSEALGSNIFNLCNVLQTHLKLYCLNIETTYQSSVLDLYIYKHAFMFWFERLKML